MQRTEDKKRAEAFKPGDRLPASWVQKVENFISSFKVLSGGQFIWDGRTAALQIYAGGGGAFNGQAYTPAGAFYEDLTDAEKPWLKYDLSTGAITEEVGPPSDPWPANESWRKKGDFKGAIYF